MLGRCVFSRGHSGFEERQENNEPRVSDFHIREEEIKGAGRGEDS